MADFEMSEDGKRVLKCPGGHEPRTCNYNRQTQQCLLSFDREHCVNCPFQDQCKPKIYKRVAKKSVSRKSVVRAQVRKQMQTERFRFMAKIRNGVETIPSLLKNRYHANEMPVHGLQR
ncbi:MAG: transposase, partial [Ruminococcus sp.]|nr:transposase [Ruminococcus sp.]